MKTNKTFLHSLLVLLTTVLFTGNLHAQVTIGEETPPMVFSLLELSTEHVKGGLRLPHLTSAERTSLSNTYSATHPDLLKGLFIYNTTIDCIEYWNNSEWISLCCEPAVVMASSTGTVNVVAGQPLKLWVNAKGTPNYKWYKDNVQLPLDTAIYTINPAQLTDAGKYKVHVVACGDSVIVDNITVNVIPDRKDPGFSLGTGAAKLTGKTCFDVVETNNGGTCGTLTSRAPQKVNFVVDYKHTYTFTNPGTITNLCFYFDDPTGLVIDSIKPQTSGLNGGQNLTAPTYSVDVYFKTDLNTTAKGLDRNNALKATIFATYTQGGVNRYVELQVSVQDCTCCEGYLSKNGAWVPISGRFPKDYPTGTGTTWATIGPDFVNYSNQSLNKDLCFYKLNHGHMIYTASNPDNPTFVCTNLDGGGWRLPNLAELVFIHSIASTLSSQPTSIAGTQNMITTFAGANGYYWNTSFRTAGNTINGWLYSNGGVQIVSTGIFNSTRCVKTMD